MSAVAAGSGPQTGTLEEEKEVFIYLFTTIFHHLSAHGHLVFQDYYFYSNVLLNILCILKPLNKSVEY